MTSIRKNPFRNQKLLTGFIRQVRSVSDTPSLIRLIAADAGYLKLCREIVNDASQPDQKFFRFLKAVCRKHGLDFQRLQQKLMPVARALGLTPSSHAQLDYYRLLGVSPRANASEIKKAFRKKAYNVHPDTSADGQSGSQKFVELNAAYQTLSDPVLRKHYDLSRQNLNRWYERPLPVPKADRVGRAVFGFQLAGLLIILILLIFLFNFLFLENNILDEFHSAGPNPSSAPQSLLAMPTDVTRSNGQVVNDDKKQFAATISAERKKDPRGLPEAEHAVADSNSSSPKINREQKQADAIAVDAKSTTVRKPETAGNVEEANAVKRSSHRPTSERKLTVPAVRSVRTDNPSSRRSGHKKDKAPSGFALAQQSAQKASAPPVSKSPGTAAAKEAPIETSLAPELNTARLEPQAGAGDNHGSSDLKKRLQNFLRTYCRTYEDKNLAQFAAFFTTDATENGKPFHDWLPKYRQNFDTTDFINYRIKLQKFIHRLDSGIISIEGKFFLEWRPRGAQWRKNSGKIFMELFEHGSAYRVHRLKYYGEK